MDRHLVSFSASCGVLAAAIVLLQGVSAVAQVAGEKPEAQPAEAKSGSALVGSQGTARRSERAIAAALNWLARHQSRDGTWGLRDFSKQCKGTPCTGPGSFSSDAAGTALGLLPFFGAGQTHETKGPYRKNVYDGLYWLMRNQQRWGDLSGAEKPEGAQMYAYGLATISLCEAYGQTHSKVIGKSAQAAVNFIQSAQHPSTGGWRYNPGQEGDTSVLGWQLTALKSAELAGLQVNARVFDGARRWLKSVAKGEKGGQYAYTPESSATPSMTAVGTFCSLLLGSKPDDPAIAEGVKILTANPPGLNPRNAYYVYYGTRAMHQRMDGPAWDRWNRQLRRVLCESQIKEGCAAGSWDPDKPEKDAWGEPGGRLYTTSLSALALESYYRYLLIDKLDAPKKDAK
jgi:hypothetical protein